jgi:uncharacterized membrane protein YuzA (DUF378 family)
VPSVLAGVLVSAHAGVVLGVASRLSQPTELAAQSIASLGTQRLAAEPARARDESRWMIRVALAIAVVCAVGVGGVGSLVAARLGAPGGAARIVMIISGITLIPKFVDYQQVARLVAAGRIRQRLKASAIVAASVLVACVLVALLTRAHEGVAVVSLTGVVLAGELLFLAVLLRSRPRAELSVERPQ